MNLFFLALLIIVWFALLVFVLAMGIALIAIATDSFNEDESEDDDQIFINPIIKKPC